MNFSDVDIFIGALEENLIKKENLIASYSYYHDHLTWCVQKRQRIPLWKNVFHICSDPVVILIFTVQTIMVISLAYFLQQFERHPKWDWNRLVFNGACCYCGFPCAYRPENNANRILYLFFLFGCQIFLIVLGAGLIFLINQPVLNPQIESIEEIIYGNFKLLGDEYAFTKISQKTKVN